MNQPRRRRMGTQLGRRTDRSQPELAEPTQQPLPAPLPEGHGQIVRDPQEPKVATVRPPQRHVDGEGREVVPYRQINQADPAAPALHGQGQVIDAPPVPAHQVGAPPPAQGAHHPVGHGDPRTTPQSQPQAPTYRIQASTSNPAGAQAVDPQHGFATMQQQYGGGVQKVGGQPVQSVAGAGVGRMQTAMPASVQAVPGIVSPDQARMFMAQQQPGNVAAPQANQFQGGAAGISAGAGARQPQPGGPPPGSAEVLQESSVATIALADEATMRAELEAAGQSHRLQTRSTTIQRRVGAEQVAPKPRLDVTVILTCYQRPQLLRAQLDALRSGTKIPALVTVMLVGEGPHPADALADGRPWVEPVEGRPRPLLQNVYRFGATPWTRFSLALDMPTKYVAILDDDCIPGPGWLEACVEASEAGLEAAICAAGVRLNEDGSVSGLRGVVRDPGGGAGIAVSDFPDDPTLAAKVDAGMLGWFLRTEWLPSVAQLGPAGHVPYGWQVHASAALQLDGQIPTVVLPYSTTDRGAWGATDPAQSGGLRDMQGMDDLRKQVFGLYREDEEGATGWQLVAELPEQERALLVPVAPTPAPATADAPGAAPGAAPVPQLPEGAYWSPRLSRYVEPGQREWSAEHYELATGRVWEGEVPAARVTDAPVTDAPQLATRQDAPGTLGRAEGATASGVRDPEVVAAEEAAAAEAAASALPAARVVDVKPAVVELEAGEHRWCSCGESEKQPICDPDHVCEGREPVLLKLEQKRKVVLCMCKATKNPPYCDGTHAKVAVEQKRAAEGASASAE